MLCAGFCKHERAVGKIESCQAVASRQSRTARPPVQATGNHQVQHKPKIALHSNGNSLADRSQVAHNVAFHIGERWLYRTKQEGAGQPYVLDRLRHDPCFKRADISGNIGQFRHVPVCKCACNPATKDRVWPTFASTNGCGLRDFSKPAAWLQGLVNWAGFNLTTTP